MQDIHVVGVKSMNALMTLWMHEGFAQEILGAGNEERCVTASSSTITYIPVNDLPYSFTECFPLSLHRTFVDIKW